ncbi:MAG: hypothetical protein EOR46_32740 [Mesorhizobium sp.]|nr:MAG: hypothetical protein EOR46_32740 [Mesorhizobium sp.]RWK61435.1 MAG: hypothetical protein EOR54_33245 [Mesorhizobium sp.]RWK70822.1 MAG: hypothetical protein EOR50_33485 [Mesorhizobium sp.]RWK74498.1 MAG: hypothetical protein EOR51_33810 [Mesorhizobium sp.]RWK98824.1 MAG: hypothetical protein EOR55_34275 [Mesorhizobium sp.]
MRGLLMAPLAFDVPGRNANHWAGRFGASARSSKTTFLAKKPVKRPLKRSDSLGLTTLSRVRPGG